MWRWIGALTLGKGRVVIEDVNTRTVKSSCVLDRGVMLYVVSVSQVLGSSLDKAALDSLKTREQALSDMTMGEYVNRLHDIFNCHDRLLEELVKRGVANWPFDVKKVKPVMFKNITQWVFSPSPCGTTDFGFLFNSCNSSLSLSNV